MYWFVLISQLYNIKKLPVIFCWYQVEFMYTVRQKTGPLFSAYNFRNIEHIFTKLGTITFSSFWASCHNLFESTLENSGAIWRITLTVNKKVIKVMNFSMTAPCGSFCYAFDNCSLNFVNWWQTLMNDDGRPSAELHPRWQVTVFKFGLFGAQSELQVLTLQVFVFLAVREGAPPCWSDH